MRQANANPLQKMQYIDQAVISTEKAQKIVNELTDHAISNHKHVQRDEEFLRECFDGFLRDNQDGGRRKMLELVKHLRVLYKDNSNVAYGNIEKAGILDTLPSIKEEPWSEIRDIMQKLRVDNDDVIEFDRPNVPFLLNWLERSIFTSGLLPENVLMIGVLNWAIEYAGDQFAQNVTNAAIGCIGQLEWSQNYFGNECNQL